MTMRNTRPTTLRTFAVGSLLLGAACNLVSGIEELEVREPSSGTTTTDGGGAMSDDSSVTPVGEAGQDAGPQCREGYAPSDAGCVFVNPFVDPSFQGTPPNAWTLLSGATLNADVAGPNDLGVATLQDRTRNPELRSGGIAQTVTMPTVVGSEPFAIDVRARIESGFSGGRGPMSIFIADRLAEEGTGVGAPGVNPISVRRCLGELAYGGKVPFSFFASEINLTRLELDRVAIVPDASCPAPGKVPNGDFEAAGSWTVSSNATIAGTFGTNGGRGAQLISSSGFGGRVTTTVSIPATSMAGPAVRFRTYTAATANVHVLVDDVAVGRARANAATTTQEVCLPVWSRGLVLPLAFGAGGLQGAPGGGPAETVAIDDVAFVDVPACAPTNQPSNAGFEVAGAPIAGWYDQADTGFTAARNTTNPHTGSGRLTLTASAGCAFGGRAYASQVVALPASTVALGGPVLRYWYLYSAGAGVSVTTQPGSSVTPTATWTEKKTCLAPAPMGTRVALSFELRGGGSCAAAELDIDDVSIGNDVSCPIQ